MTDLPTVDLSGVEILRANVRIHGQGSPPEGDLYSTDDLRALCDAHAELASERRPCATIGHGGTERPALGTLENLRVRGDRLLCDVKRAPRAFGQLVNARAFNGRSIELSRSRRTGRLYVSALAFLGHGPAVPGLRDVVALFEDGDAELLRAYSVVDGAKTAKVDALLDHAVSTGRIVDADRPTWARAFERDEDGAIRELSQITPNTAVSDEDYARDFAARSAGQRPFFAQDREASRRELSEDDVDPESAEIATRLGLNPAEVI